MRKTLFILFLFIIILVGCENVMNTPTSKVEDYYSRYQNLDKIVLYELDEVLDNTNNMTDKEKKEYKELLERQYQNLSYKITNEEINGNRAVVDSEIEVLDYKNAVEKIDNSSNYNSRITEKKIKEMKKVKNKKKYTITFNLTREDGIWILEKISNEDIKKIHGLY